MPAEHPLWRKAGEGRLRPVVEHDLVIVVHPDDAEGQTVEDVVVGGQQLIEHVGVVDVHARTLRPRR